LATVEMVRSAVASSVRRLRSRKRWTLEELALRSGVSKAMIVEIEQARTNPSIATLCHLAEALGTSVPALVEVSEEPRLRLVRSSDAVRLWTGAGGGSGTLLAGSETPNRVELWEWRLTPGDSYSAEGHAAGTREMLHVLAGSLKLHVGEEVAAVPAGDTVLFRADRAHRYANGAQEDTRFLMVIIQPGADREADGGG
jgi:transcriptional regulator with XRE-family HTH domain